MVITHLRWRPEFCGPYTIDDLDTLRQVEGLRVELAYGWLLVSPSSPSPGHSLVCVRLVMSLETKGSRTGLFTARSPGTIMHAGLEFIPDVLVTPGRQPLSSDWGSLTTQLLAIEVLSHSTRATDLGFKRSAYLEMGVPEVWLVDPLERTMRVARSGVADDVTLTPPDVLRWRGATIDLTALFSDD